MKLLNQNLWKQSRNKIQSIRYSAYTQGLMRLTRIALKAFGGLIGFLAGAFAFIHRFAGRFFRMGGAVRSQMGNHDGVNAH